MLKIEDYLTHSGIYEGLYYFQVINSKASIIAWQESKLVYNDITVNMLSNTP